jgi:hypothetical protein
MPIRIIGDVHGKYIPYAKICKDAELKGLHTLQIGDMGFNFGHFKHFGLEPDKHFFFGGNHDNYDTIKDCPNNIGDFGLVPGYSDFFFVRGAYSIDKAYRVEGRDWWAEEELDMSLCYKALEEYKSKRPDTMITHDCPDCSRDWMIKHKLSMSSRTINTRTGQILQAMFEYHQPRIWIFGHWHQDVSFDIQGTKFICLDELSHLDLEGKP